MKKSCLAKKKGEQINKKTENGDKEKSKRIKRSQNEGTCAPTPIELKTPTKQYLNDSNLNPHWEYLFNLTKRKQGLKFGRKAFYGVAMETKRF